MNKKIDLINARNRAFKVFLIGFVLLVIFSLIFIPLIAKLECWGLIEAFVFPFICMILAIWEIIKINKKLKFL